MLSFLQHDWDCMLLEFTNRDCASHPRRDESIRVGLGKSEMELRLMNRIADTSPTFRRRTRRARMRHTADWTWDPVRFADEDDPKRGSVELPRVADRAERDDGAACSGWTRHAHAARAAGDSSGTSCDRQVREDAAREAALDDDHSHPQAADSSPVSAESHSPLPSPTSSRSF
ncbi:hypothetical protein BLNAU_15336 [Blattamonas nauphoetae]|uniref:Uncharacterized protein n=1 Tax=Blattamonas nauphoetae TaxID=2049346 RepID=A0ABQ9XB56_9EUKA|nr:hypothetical protein BLNAU_15336 [Blattamonas nauphoetae]